jgi:hypothetical protein
LPYFTHSNVRLCALVRAQEGQLEGRFSISPPKRLFSTAPYTPIAPVPSFDVSPDNKRFLLLRESGRNHVSMSGFATDASSGHPDDGI